MEVQLNSALSYLVSRSGSVQDRSRRHGIIWFQAWVPSGAPGSSRRHRWESDPRHRHGAARRITHPIYLRRQRRLAAGMPAAAQAVQIQVTTNSYLGNWRGYFLQVFWLNRLSSLCSHKYTYYICSFFPLVPLAFDQPYSDSRQAGVRPSFPTCMGIKLHFGGGGTRERQN